MSEYRIDTLPAGAQQSVIYLHGVASVQANADVIFFIGADGGVIATAPIASRIAYVAL